MHVNTIIFITFLAISALLGWYIYRRIRQYSTRRWIRIAHVAICAAAVGSVAPVAFVASAEVSDAMFMTQMWGLVVYISVTFAQITYTILDSLCRIPGLFIKKRTLNFKTTSIIAAAVACLVFASCWWGALINRYNIDIEPIEIDIADLSDNFNGFTIAQISDLHLGSYNGDTTFVSSLVDRINSLEPDLVVFTGDIVNRHSVEAVPFMPVLDRLRGKHGQFAILGNHDYADYFYPVDSINQKEADRKALREMYAATSLNLLRDSSVWINIANDSILLIGVENIGTGRFPVYGSVERAYPALADQYVKILLSHDPTHWETAIADNPAYNIALTLSGHTHAMQTRVLGFSPSRWAYPHYAGLVTDSLGRHLYINIGIGTVGFPMRVGATPEITLITLRPQ